MRCRAAPRSVFFAHKELISNLPELLLYRLPSVLADLNARAKGHKGCFGQNHLVVEGAADLPDEFPDARLVAALVLVVKVNCEHELHRLVRADARPRHDSDTRHAAAAMSLPKVHAVLSSVSHAFAVDGDSGFGGAAHSLEAIADRGATPVCNQTPANCANSH